MYETIMKPIAIGNLKLKNRIVFAPTTMGLKKEEYLNKLENIAKGGVSLIIIGDVGVMPGSGHSLYSKKGMAYYKEVVECIHRNKAMACAQLHMSDSNWKAMLKYIPQILTKKITADQMRKLLNKEAKKFINQMSPEKIRKIIKGFGTAAILAEEAGFDMIQIHGDRMCGSFSSSLLNERQDEFGGSLQNRMRFALEAIHQVKRAVPEMAIEYKLPVRQQNPAYGKAGFTEEELKEAVPILEKAGIDSFHVTLANHGELTDTIPPRTHSEFSQEGCFLKFSRLVKQYTDLPVCGVGGLTDPDFIEKQLKEGCIDYAAMSRQLIADPYWVKKIEEENGKGIVKCIRCNKKCLGGIKEHKGVHCIFDKEEQ